MNTTSGQIEIHLASADDAQDFAALIHELDDSYGTPIPETIEETAAYIIDAGIGPKAPIEALIARLDGTAIGFASFNKLYPTDDGRLGVHMKDLYIISAARGRGVGRALMKAMATLCQERGYKRLIWTTTHDNEAAKALYDGLGAERQDEKLHYRLGADAIARLSEAG